MSLSMSGSTTRMRRTSIETSCEDAVRDVCSRRCTHGEICRSLGERPLSCRDHVPDECVRVQSRKTERE